jgi:hypothetical protein
MRLAFLLPADWPIAIALNLDPKGGAFVPLVSLPRQRRRAPGGVADIDISSRRKHDLSDRVITHIFLLTVMFGDNSTPPANVSSGPRSAPALLSQRANCLSRPP